MIIFKQKHVFRLIKNNNNAYTKLSLHNFVFMTPNKFNKIFVAAKSINTEYMFRMHTKFMIN